MKQIIGVDLGGTNIDAGLVTLKGNIIRKISVKTEADKGKKRVLRNIFKAIEQLMNKGVVAIGIGSPGPMNITTGVLKELVNLPLNKVPLKSVVRRRFKLPVFLDNDTNCFALAESVFGAGRLCRTVIGLTLGTGVGGGIIMDRKVFHGRNNAGELGHMTIDYKGIKTSYGNYGDLEEYCSGRGIVKTADGKGLKASCPEQVEELAGKGSRKAREAWKEYGFYLGAGIVNIIHSFDPDIVVIGGRISRAWRFFAGEMNKTVKQRMLFRPCRIVRASLKDAGIVGAASLALHEE